VRILLISGSTRGQSTNTAVLRTAQEVAPAGMTAVLFEGMTALPHFNPDDDRDPLPLPVAELRSEIARADAVVFSTPEYAGALPGSFKNLLDWTVGGGEIYRKPVAWINASSSPTGAADAHASLRKVLGYLSVEIVEPACARIAVSRNDVAEDGLINNPELRTRIASVLTTLADHVAHQTSGTDGSQGRDL
jgi:chromate reductase, NAD(P)H dehydrogenase (quinone)